MNAVVCPEEGASASDCWSSHESNGLPDLSSSSSDRSAAHADYESEETLACDFEVPASMSTSPQSGAPIRHACTKTEAPFGRLYSDVLDRMCAANGLNSYLPSRDDCVSIFYSTFRQPFTLESYVARIVHYTNCSRSVFVVALIYMDRIKRSDPRMAISELNVHRILMTAVVLSVKYLEDELYQNSQFAKIGGIPSVSEFVS